MKPVVIVLGVISVRILIGMPMSALFLVSSLCCKIHLKFLFKLWLLMCDFSWGDKSKHLLTPDREPMADLTNHYL